jgi:hypothetical protein
VCEHCGDEFSRHWNLQRHIKLIHGGSTIDVKQANSSGPANYSASGQPLLPLHAPRGDHIVSSSADWPFGGLSQTSNAMKTLAELNESIARFRPSSLPNLEYLQRELNVRNAELSNIHSNYWSIHKSAIQGISGFFCKRCQAFESDFVRDLGFDLTAEARHLCDEIKVKSIHAVSIRKSDEEAKDNLLAPLLLRKLNFLMPGVKYLARADFSAVFDLYRSTFGYDNAKIMIGIPHRLSLYRLDGSENLPWLAKALNNPGKKTELKDDEVVDFLGRVKSSYALFEIPTPDTPKMILLALTS